MKRRKRDERRRDIIAIEGLGKNLRKGKKGRGGKKGEPPAETSNHARRYPL